MNSSLLWKLPVAQRASATKIAVQIDLDLGNGQLASSGSSPLIVWVVSFWQSEVKCFVFLCLVRKMTLLCLLAARHESPETNRYTSGDRIVIYPTQLLS
jgi:hypothetical protein